MKVHPAHELENHIMSVMEQGYWRLTPGALLSALRSRMPEATRAQVQSAVKSMVQSGLLAYIENCGTSYLETGRSGLLRVSERIVLYQGYGPVPKMEGAVVIRMTGGASFGFGDHPTTRMALRGLDIVALQLAKHKFLEAAAALDVGTGTGVLAIAAAKLGIKQVVGIDIDAVACHEARLNARDNDVERELDIVYGPLADLSSRRFDVILANLRPPTLVTLAEKMLALTHDGGFWILSGFREHERPALEGALPQRCREVWSGVEKTWCAAVYKLTSAPSSY